MYLFRRMRVDIQHLSTLVYTIVGLPDQAERSMARARELEQKFGFPSSESRYEEDAHLIETCRSGKRWER